ncbi:hypothetical protein [Micromonospora sp. NPDC093277]|uniref:hypothetical protein n=1 Tax=Micromonospora sp. NPDC093277 TaxID=3364291 RepID=UPI0037F9BD00
MPVVVNEAYINNVNNLLTTLRNEVPSARNGLNPSGTGPNDQPVQLMDNVRLLAGTDAYPVGTGLAVRANAQAKALSDQLNNEGTFFGLFVSNTQVFLRESDDTEDLNALTAAEFAPYLPTA